MKTNMEKEIFTQGAILKAIKEAYVAGEDINFKIDTNFQEIKFIASGSSYNVARLGHKFFETFTSKRVGFEYASEFISNANRSIKKDTLYCFVSQSGETYDTKCALDIVKKEGGKTLALVNSLDSTIYNECDYKIYVLAGIEYSVAATKSFLSSVVCAWLLALYFAKREGINIKQKLDTLNEAIEAVYDVLSDISSIEKISDRLSKKKKLSIIGYDLGYILAKEGALKIKETSYIDISAYPTGEFLHGHSAILNKNKTLIEIFLDDYSSFEENTLKKIKKDFNPLIIAITDKKIKNKNTINFKKYKSPIAKVCAIAVILQLLALKTALKSGFDVDKPLGLTKVVKGAKAS